MLLTLDCKNTSSKNLSVDLLLQSTLYIMTQISNYTIIFWKCLAAVFQHKDINIIAILRMRHLQLRVLYQNQAKSVCLI